MKTLFINDDPLYGAGGAALTLLAFYEAGKDCSFLTVKEVNEGQGFEPFKDADTIVLGNIFTLTEGGLLKLINGCSNKKIVKIEFDYNYSTRRSPLLKRLFGDNHPDYHSGDRRLRAIYEWLIKDCNVFIYMSESQRLIHRMDLGPCYGSQFIVSSCFTNRQWEILETTKEYRLNNLNKIKNCYCILGSKTEWESFCKGQEESVTFCMVNGLAAQVLSYESDYSKFIENLATYSGIVFLPKNFDTNPRILIESKFLGLTTIINENCQNWPEKWWRCWSEDSIKYIKEQPQKFWSIINA